MEWYYKLLANHPQFILLVIGIFCTSCIVVSLSGKLPDFSDPTLGFEARGTPLGHRNTAWRHILSETRDLGGKLTSNPYEYLDEEHETKKHWRKHNPPGSPQRERERLKKTKKKNDKLRLSDKISEIKNANGTLSNRLGADNEIPEDYDSDAVWIENGTVHPDDLSWQYGRNMSFREDEEKWNRSVELHKENWMQLTRPHPPPPIPLDINRSPGGFFCGSPADGYSHFVMERINHNLTASLFEINALLAMCDLEQRLISGDLYRGICERQTVTDECCRPWSLPNYVALLANRTHCFDITAEDVDEVHTLLTSCFPYFNDLRLSSSCVRFPCKNVPTECTQFNAVFNIFQFITDSKVISPNETELYLRRAMVFLPIAMSTKMLPFYHSIMQKPLRNELVSIPAMEMGLKYALFDECLINDAWLVAMSALFVVLCMCLYTSSVFITLMTIVAIGFSLGVSHFIYTYVYRISYFPFMNLLALIVVIGIGADDAFVFIKMWQCAIAERAKRTTAQESPTTTTGAAATPQPRATVIRASNASLPTSFCGQFWRRLMRRDRPTVRGPTTTTSRRLASSRTSVTSDMGGAATTTALMAYTLRTAGLSMLVTSATTAAAFFATVTSSITAVRCFGIFAGTAVIVNYVLMMTWLPATVSWAERLPCLCFRTLSFNCLNGFCNKMRIVSERIEKTIARVIMCVPWVWIALFGSLGLMSGVVVFYWPGLQLPTSTDFKLFVGSHPFELYDSQYKKFFYFEKNISAPEDGRFPLRFVWGVKPVDHGNYLNPASRGHLVLDDEFNMSSRRSQEWLLKFCREVRMQPFYQTSSFNGLMPNCFIEHFYDFMARRCYDGMAEVNREPCCESSPRPYPARIFNECVPFSIKSLFATPTEYRMPGVAGPKFQQHVDNNFSLNTSQLVPVGPAYSRKAVLVPAPPRVVAVIVEFESSQPKTSSYVDMDVFVKSVEAWLATELNEAPIPMRKGFFTSDLEFYDLQDTLSKGTWTSVTYAMMIAFVVLFLVTLNILISLYAIITVTMTICATVAILVLLGWQLNVLESAAVTTVIGLAVDFSLHYGVHYKMAPDRVRGAAARFSLSRMMGPTAMAALTTAAAGAFMLPSSVVAYIQIGVFLIVVMTTSWLYSTFFLMSLLYVLGPEHNFGQFRYRAARPRRTRGGGGAGGLTIPKPDSEEDDDNNTPTNPVSEQLLSMSSSGAADPIVSESHEMESLTSESVVKPPSQLECNQPINFDRALRRTTTTTTTTATIEPSPTTATTSGTVILPDELSS